MLRPCKVHGDFRTLLEDWPSVCIPLGMSPAFSLDIRASLELDRMLGNGNLIGELETTWDEPFNG